MRLRAAVPALLLAGCVPSGHPDTSAFDPVTPPPTIEEVELACDKEAGIWRVDVGTDAWSGGAVLLWTTDGEYVERHDQFRSVAARPDGLGDLLRNDIAVVGDFRGSGNGRSAFTCRDEPSAVIWVLDLQRNRTDCIHGGPAPELILGLEGVPECPRTWNPPPDTDAAETDSDTDETDDS